MPNKKTLEEFELELSNLDTNIKILGEFVNCSTKVLVKHDVPNCGYEWMGLPASLSQGIGCPKCGRTLLKTHEDFVKEMKEKSPNIEILSKYVKNKVKVKCKCKIDGYEWEVTPANLIRGHGCPACSGRATVVGYTDLATTSPWMLDYLEDITDGSKYTKYSKQKIAFKCPDCGSVSTRIIANVYRGGFNCKVCKDNISYPNKFLRALLLQLDVDNLRFEYKKIRPYAYDSYFELNNKQYIVEMDGNFHYEDNRISGESKEARQLLDSAKDACAKGKGICVIRIDCRKSEKEYIMNNIVSSELSNLFDLSKIDFDKCDIWAKTNYIKRFCEYYETHKKTDNLIDIVNKYGIGLITFCNYYEHGLKYGWCS